MKNAVSLSKQIRLLIAEANVVPMSSAQRERALLALIDTIACMAAGSDHPIISKLKLACNQRSSQPQPNSFGWLTHSDQNLSPTQHALVLGAQAHVLDFDDNFFPVVSHASAVTFSALFVLSINHNVSWGRLLHAYCLSLQLQILMHSNWGNEHYEAGWHATSTIGTLGAAFSCAWVLKLDETATFNALSIATSLMGGSKVQFGSELKPLHAGFAAQHGVQAALLAQSGILASNDPFGGLFSVSNLFSVSRETNHVSSENHDGILLAKIYPCCMSTHIGIDAVLKIRLNHESANQLSSMHFRMPSFMVNNLPYSQPITPEQARFSMQHAAAVAWLYGAPTLEHFAEPYISHPAVIALRECVFIDQIDDAKPDLDRPWGSSGVILDCKFADESSVRHVEYAPCGAPEKPLTPDQRQKKFDACLQTVLPLSERNNVFDRIYQADDLDLVIRVLFGNSAD